MEFRTATSRIDLPRLAREDARAVVDRLLNRSADEPFCAAQILAEQPELREFSSCVLDLAYEEFCRTREAGQSVAATQFARLFPDVQQSLYRVIEFDQILHQHPSLIDEVPEDRWPVAGDVFGEFQLLDFNLAWSTDDALRFAGGALPYMASEQLEALSLSDTRPATPSGRDFRNHASAASTAFRKCRIAADTETKHHQRGDSRRSSRLAYCGGA